MCISKSDACKLTRHSGSRLDTDHPGYIHRTQNMYTCTHVHIYTEHDTHRGIKVPDTSHSGFIQPDTDHRRFIELNTEHLEPIGVDVNHSEFTELEADNLVYAGPRTYGTKCISKSFKDD